jgi:DNA polymerase III delta prime subunit
VIPKIIITNNSVKEEEQIEHFATRNGIEPLYRMVVQPEKDSLTVEQIHLFQKDIQISFSKPVLAIFKGVDDSSNEVQNSLLKCLEEESERIVFLLLIKNVSRLLPTIVSRCSIVTLAHKPDVISDKEADVQKFTFSNNSEATKEEAVTRIDSYIQFSSQKNLVVLKHLLTIRKLILDNNMNPVLALDEILIFILKNSSMNMTHE